MRFDTSVDNRGLQSGLDAASMFAASTAANITAQIVAAVGSAFAAIPEKIIEVGSQFESSMSQVAATMGITTAAEEFEQLSETAKAMGENTKFSASQAADALNYLALAGYDAEKSCAALPTVLNLASAGGMELAQASDMVTDSMSALGLSMNELEGFADKMAVTSQKSNTSVSQLGAAILSVGANAQILSGGTTELMTELGILADSGLKSAEAGTDLARVIKNLSTPTSAAAKELEALGVECYDSEGNFRNMQDIFADLQEAMDGFTAEQVQASMSEIFDTAALSSAKVLLSQCGDRFEELSGYIDNADGSAAQMAETMSDNLTGDITICQSALEGLANTAYEKFQGTMRTAVQAVTADVGTLTESMKSGELSESVDKLADAFGNAAASAASFVADDVIPAVIRGFTLIVEHGNEIISVVAGIGAALVAWKAITAINDISMSFNKAVIAVTAFSTAEEVAAFKAAAHAGKLSLAQIAAGVYTGQISLATGVTGAFNAVLAANPIGAVAAAIGIAVTVIGGFIGKMKEAKAASEAAEVAAYDYAGAMEEVKEQGEETIKSTDSEIALLKDKVGRYEELRQKYDQLNEGEMTEFLSLCEDLQEVLPEGTKLIDAQSGAYIALSDSIDKVCERMERQALLNAKQGEYEEAVSQNYDIDKRLSDADSWWKNQQIIDPENASGMDLNSYCKEKYGLSYDELTATKQQNQNIIDEYHDLYTKTYEELSSGSETDSSTVGGTTADEDDKSLEEKVKKQQERQAKATKALSEGWERLEHRYAIGSIKTEEELLEAKKLLWQQYGSKYVKDHWKYQEDIISSEEAIAEQRKEAAEQAERDRTEAEKEAAEAKKQELADKWSAVENLAEMEYISEKEAYEKKKALIEEYCPEYSDEWADYYKDVHQLEKQFGEESAQEQEKQMQEEWERIRKYERMGWLTSEEAYKKRKEFIQRYCPEYSDEWYDYYQEIYDYEKEFAEKQLADRKELLNEELSAVKSNIDTIISEYKQAYSDIQSNISAYKNKLIEVGGSAFSVEETENEDGTKTRKLKVNDIAGQIAKMKKYHEVLKAMKEKGAPLSLLQEFQGLDPDDGIVMAENLLSSGDLEQLSVLYKEKEKVAQQLAEDFYADDIQQLNNDTSEKILEQYSELPAEFSKIGNMAALSLALGLNSGISDLSTLLESGAEQLFADAGAAVDGMTVQDMAVNAEVQTEDMAEKGEADGEAYKQGFSLGIEGIAGDVALNGFITGAAAGVDSGALTNLAGIISEALKNVTIKNMVTAELKCDGKTIAEVVNEENSTAERVSDL